MSDDARLQVVLEAKIDKLQASLNKANQATGQWAAKTQKHVDETNSKWNTLFGHSDPGKAIERVFSRSRIGLLEEGGAKIGVFGSALEELGPAGLVAGAGLAAVAIGLEETHRALEYADGLYKVAKNAHITSDALQELQYALRVEGGDETQAGAALESFSQKLGLAKEGAPKALRAFRALFGQGFTAQDAKNLGDTGHALEVVTGAISQLKSNDLKDASVGQFGLDGLKPLIEAGPDKMRELRAEAVTTGQVLDSALVQKGHELNEQAETLSRRIKNDLTGAFVDLGPILIGLVGFMAKMADKAADVVDAFKKIDERRVQTLADQREQALRQSREGILPGTAAAARNRAATFTSALIQRELGRGGEKPEGEATGSRDLHDLTKHSAGPRDDTAAKADEVAQAIAQADRALLEAEKSLTENIADRAEFERQALAAQGEAEKASLDKKIDAIAADKGISESTKTRLTAALEQTKLEVDKTTAARQDLVARNAAYAIEDRTLEVSKARIEAQLAELEAQAKVATTAEQRVAIEARILAIRQQLEKDLAETQIDRRVRTGELSADQGKSLKDSFGAQQANERTGFVVANRGPLDAYLASIQDLNTEIQTAGVSAAKSLSAGLADAIVNAKNLGDVGRSVFRQLVADILQAVIEKQIGGSIASLVAAIPGFAGGTNFAPGGLAIVGEKGPEPVFLPRGARVGTNADLNALTSLNVPQRQGAAVVQQFSFDLRGAVMTEDLLRQMEQIGAQAAAAGGQMGFQRSMSRLQKSRTQTLGRP